MKDRPKPFSILRLHSFDERCWGVVDAVGSLVDVDGLSMKMTRHEASELAAKLNDRDGDHKPRAMVRSG